jgi:hypothetical protein
MEIPTAIRQRLGGEEIESAIALGDEDLLCFTPTRTLRYSGQGLFSDESVEIYEHDLERLGVSTGRRKTAFTLEYLDRVESFSVPRDRGEAVLERLLGSVLRAAGVVEVDEEIRGTFRFSELSVVVTDERLVKHVGSYVWDPDYEEFRYEDVTGLSFEDGSVATQIVISTATGQQRIKTPNDQAPVLRETLQETMFAHHGVESLDALNDRLGPSGGADKNSGGGDFELDDSITPLVGTGENEEQSPEENGGERETEPGIDLVETAGTEATSHTDADASTDGSAGSSAVTERTPDTQEAKRERHTGDSADTTAPDTGTETPNEWPEGTTKDGGVGDKTGGNQRHVDPADVEAIEAQLAALTDVVKKQHTLLAEQQKTVEQLAEELRKQR